MDFVFSECIQSLQEYSLSEYKKMTLLQLTLSPQKVHTLYSGFKDRVSLECC